MAKGLTSSMLVYRIPGVPYLVLSRLMPVLMCGPVQSHRSYGANMRTKVDRYM